MQEIKNVSDSSLEDVDEIPKELQLCNQRHRSRLNMMLNVMDDSRQYFDILTLDLNKKYRQASLSKESFQQMAEYIRSSSITSSDMSILLLGREIAHITHNPDVAERFNREVDVVKAKILETLLLYLPLEYQTFAEPIQQLDLDPRENQKLLKLRLTRKTQEYFISRLESGDATYALTEEGRRQIKLALINTLKLYHHSDWDHIVSATIMVVSHRLNLEGEAFEELLGMVHGNNNVASSLFIEGRDNNWRKCMALMGLRNSGVYGNEKMWRFLPLRLQEFLRASDIRTLISLGRDYKERDIRRSITSIIKADNFGAMYELAKSIYELEADPEIQSIFLQELLRYGIDLTLDRGYAMDFYEQFNKIGK